jgi:chemotaxis protein CheC
MILTEQQNDSLTELINIAFGRTASSLSELTGQRVILDVPKLSLHRVDQVLSSMGNITMREVATIHQMFSGNISGDAVLILDHEGAILLASLLTNEQFPEQELTFSTREVLTEVGNILLNACVGMFGNILHLRISFTLPSFHLETLDGLLNSIMIGKEEMRYALLIYTGFLIKDNGVNGYLMLVLGVKSLDRLIQAIEEWEREQTSGV